MAELQVGTEVERVNSGAGYNGDKGMIVEVTPDRVRVYWHSQRKPKRTWVKPSVVRAVVAAKRIEGMQYRDNDGGSW